MGLFTALSQKVLSLLISPSIRGFVKAQMPVRCPATTCVFEKLFFFVGHVGHVYLHASILYVDLDGIFRKKNAFLLDLNLFASWGQT